MVFPVCSVIYLGNSHPFEEKKQKIKEKKFLNEG
jgi:hypothetical protein